jgi:ABC-type Na+ efflux pump permease subunit
MENKTKILIFVAVLAVIIIAYVMYDKQKKAKKKAEIDAQIGSGASTTAGAATANVAPDDGYDPAADVQALLKTRGYWLTPDDPKEAIRIISSLGTKARLAKLRQEFYKVKGQDLETFLIAGWDPIIDKEHLPAYRSAINNLK